MRVGAAIGFKQKSPSDGGVPPSKLCAHLAHVAEFTFVILKKLLSHTLAYGVRFAGEIKDGVERYDLVSGKQRKDRFDVQADLASE